MSGDCSLNSAGLLVCFGAWQFCIVVLLVMAVNRLQSFSSSASLALGALGTKERPLLSRIFFALVSVMLDRLAILSSA